MLLMMGHKENQGVKAVESKWYSESHPQQSQKSYKLGSGERVIHTRSQTGVLCVVESGVIDLAHQDHRLL